MALLLRSTLDLTKVLSFSTFFFSTLMNAGPYKAYSKHVHRRDNPNTWALFDLEVIIIPLHITQNHQAVAFIDFCASKIAVYDSLDSQQSIYNDTFRAIRWFLDHQHRSVFNKNLGQQWKCEISRHSQKQNDGYNCGVYVCRYVELFIKSWQNGKSFPDASMCFLDHDGPHQLRGVIEHISRQTILLGRGNEYRCQGLIPNRSRHLLFVLNIPRTIPRFGYLLISQIPVNIWKRLQEFIE